MIKASLVTAMFMVLLSARFSSVESIEMKRLKSITFGNSSLTAVNNPTSSSLNRTSASKIFRIHNYAAGQWDKKPKTESKRIRATSNERCKKIFPKSGMPKLWPEGIVQYFFHPYSAFHVTERALISAAMRHIEDRTCIRFIPLYPRAVPYYDYILIMRGERCHSHIGRDMRMPGQVLKLSNGCMHLGIIIHELMHALGFPHEHSRLDRDEHVRILYKNIEPGKSCQFEKKYSNSLMKLLNTPFDHLSIMMYSRTAFSKNGHPTMLPLDAKKFLSQAYGLSPTDVYEVNRLYGCSSYPEKYQLLKRGQNRKIALDHTSATVNFVKKPIHSRIYCLGDHPESRSRCPAYMLLGLCSNLKITNMCAATCGRTYNCIQWAKDGYCSSANHWRRMHRYCRCACPRQSLLKTRKQKRLVSLYWIESFLRAIFRVL